MHIHFFNKQRKYKLNKSWLDYWADKLLVNTVKILNDNDYQLKKLDNFNDLKNKLIFNVFFVSDRQIKVINHEFLGKNYSTDVLSFKISEENDPYLNLINEVVFGEIFISLDKAKSQSQNFNHALEREVIFLIVHGLLHLFDFDHETPDDERIMFDLQSKILAKCNVSRNYNPQLKLFSA